MDRPDIFQVEIVLQAKGSQGLALLGPTFTAAARDMVSNSYARTTDHGKDTDHRPETCGT
jgi:hypothetical protein